MTVSTNLRLDEQNGVREYWLIELQRTAIAVWTLCEGLYPIQGTYSGQAAFPSITLGGVTINLSRIFTA